VSDVEIKNGSASIIKYSYTYDNVGNILTVKENGIEKQSFTYDKLGQLTQEDNAYANQTYTYTYDAAGNITGKYRWEYKDLSMGNGYSTYGYDNATWDDLLTNLDGTTITYDNMGNPLNWKNIYSLT